MPLSSASGKIDMKRILIAVCMAACAAWVQAVSVSWVTSGWGDPGNDGYYWTCDSAFGVGDSNYATFIVEGKLNKADTWQWGIEMFEPGSGYGNLTELGVKDGNWDVVSGGGWATTITEPNTAVAQTGHFLAGFTLAKDEEGVSITVSINGTVVAVVSADALNASDGIAQFKWNKERFEVDRIGYVVGSTEDCALPPDEIALLPEPTALALLALGVAGVTLRRRRM